jgi:hypothetical protein
MLRKFRSLDNWSKIAVFFLFTYGILGKGAVYIGLLFGGLLLFSTRVFWDRWFLALSRREDPLSPVSWALIVSLLYGIAQVIRGVVFIGYPAMIAFQILIFNICPVYMFLGLWVGMRHPGLIRTYVRFLAWWMVIYAPIYFIFLKNVHISLNGILPGTGLELLPDPGSGSMALMGLLTVETAVARFWLPILVNVCLTIGYQERSDWLGLGIVMVLWAKLTHNIGRLAIFAGAIFGVLLLAALIDLKLPPLPGRGGELSARGTISRMAGSVSPEMATKFGADPITAKFEYGTVYWRNWWANIRKEVTRDYTTEVFGLGYGYPLAHLADANVEKAGTRSPHNIFYFTVAYSGIVGFAIFGWLMVCFLHLLWKVYAVSGQTFGLVIFTYTLIGAFFGNLIETPQAAIPLYLLTGMSLATLFTHRDVEVYDDEQTMPVEVAELV